MKEVMRCIKENEQYLIEFDLSLNELWWTR
jgi:hypothetical protein